MSRLPDLTDLEKLAAIALANGWPASEVAASLATIVEPSGRNAAAPGLAGKVETPSQAVRNAFAAARIGGRV